MKNMWLTLIGFFLLPLLLLGGCQKQTQLQLHPVKVAATSVPHAEILEAIKSDLREKNIDLIIVVVEDYNIANRALQDGEIDANFFQHEPFLNSQMEDFGYELENFAAIHIEPMGLYSKKIKSLQELKPQSTLAIPSDPTNQARALCLLEHHHLIKLKQCDIKATKLDIIDNPYHLKFLEVDSPLLARALDDVDLAMITANFALQADLSPESDALIKEDADSRFTNILVIRKGEGTREDLKMLKEALTSNRIKLFIKDTYDEALSPAF